MGRILGIDLGEKRVGIALTNELNIPMPLETVKREDIFYRIEEIINEHDIDLIVVGNPMEGKRRKMVEDFVKELRGRFSVEVVEWDESFTSKRAEEILRKLKKKPSENKELIDKIAASIILEEYISSH